MRNTKDFTQVNIITVKLLLMLAVRKSELIGARKSEFDLEARLWHLPADRNKTESAITIPLPHQAVEALETLNRLSESSDWLLPARKAQDRMLPHIHENTLNVALTTKLKVLKGFYNRHDYLDERREALKLWANLLESCETGKDWNVTPIRKQA